MGCVNHISTCMGLITTQSLKEVHYPRRAALSTLYTELSCKFLRYGGYFTAVDLHGFYSQSQLVVDDGRECNGLTAMPLIVQRRLIGESKELSA